MKNLLAPALGVLLLLAASCSTLSSGRAYTVSRVDRDLTLVPANTRIIDSKNDRVGELPKSHIQIVLNSGYLRYLEAVVRPEVAIFARVYVRDLKNPEETLVWEKIFLESEQKDLQMVTNKDSFLPRINIPILPGIVYDQQEIYVSLRIIELDSDDNGRIREVVNAAATATAAFEPEAAVAASAVQTVMQFLTAVNGDDIEFQFDFALIPNGGGMEVAPCSMLPRSGATKDSDRLIDLVLEPRIGQYTIIKTEHRTRSNYPSDYFDMAHHTLRWTAASVVKLATLGLFNWRMWETFGASRNEDAYMRLFGRPFVIDYEAWQMPEYIGGKLSIPEIGGRLRMTDSRLHYEEGGLNRTFVDQTYLTLTIFEPKAGVDLKTLQKANAAKRSINAVLNTGQLTPKEAGELAKASTDALVGAIKGEEIREELDKALAAAKSEAEVEEAYKRAEKKLASLGLSPNVEAQVKSRLKERAANAHIDQGGSGNFDAPSVKGVIFLEDEVQEANKDTKPEEGGTKPKESKPDEPKTGASDPAAKKDDTSRSSWNDTPVGERRTAKLVIAHRAGDEVKVLSDGGDILESPTNDPTRTAVQVRLTRDADDGEKPVGYELAFRVGDAAYAHDFWTVPKKIQAPAPETSKGGEFEDATGNIPAKGKLRVGKLMAGKTSVWTLITKVETEAGTLKHSVDKDGNLVIENSGSDSIPIRSIQTKPLELLWDNVKTKQKNDKKGDEQ